MRFETLACTVPSIQSANIFSSSSPCPLLLASLLLTFAGREDGDIRFRSRSSLSFLVVSVFIYSHIYIKAYLDVAVVKVSSRRYSHTGFI